MEEKFEECHIGDLNSSEQSKSHNTKENDF